MKNITSTIKVSAHHLAKQVIPKEAEKLLLCLHHEFEEKRQKLLARRKQRQQQVDLGKKLSFLPETKSIRDDSSWSVAKTPSDIEKRWVEITGPTERKMLINALNSGADAFMADFEDANSPTWDNILEGQLNLYDAVRQTISYSSPEGKLYQLQEHTAVLFVRPRGWHLSEKHVTLDGTPISASFFDAAIYLFHNTQELLSQGKRPYFYLPKLESHLEARLWNDVFLFIQEYLGVAVGTIRATVLIETIWAAFEMEEILFELKEHSAGLNAGRWDYIFSAIKTFQKQNVVLPNREQITMTVPFMRAYTELLVRTCHKRGAHAIGGMAAFIPNKKDPEVTTVALQKVQEDKEREVKDGFDGTWVAHPDLVPVAKEVFHKGLGINPNQKERLREEVQVTAEQLTNFSIEGGTITEYGVRHNCNVAIQYIAFWLSGRGAVGLYNLMEDAATAEISRAQVWQWITQQARAEEGTIVTKEWVKQIIEEEINKISNEYKEHFNQELFGKAKELFEQLVLEEHFAPFLTLPAYKML